MLVDVCSDYIRAAAAAADFEKDTYSRAADYAARNRRKNGVVGVNGHVYFFEQQKQSALYSDTDCRYYRESFVMRKNAATRRGAFIASIQIPELMPVAL